MVYRIAVVPGDGIGREIVPQGRKVLEAVGKVFDHSFEFGEGLFGGAAIDATGECCPDDTLNLIESCDALLYGNSGGPRWDDLRGPGDLRSGREKLRRHFDWFADLRPARLFPALAGIAPLRPEICGDGIDILIVREKLGGLYFSRPKETRTLPDGSRQAVDTMTYSTGEIERVARIAFEAAGRRRRHVTLADKANVLECGKLWREVVSGLAREYPDIDFEWQHADNTAMQLIRNPRQFDVILTENTFGDILSDEAGALCGSLGMMPSAEMGTSRVTKFAPIHGSAPDIAGQNLANPLSSILSVGLLLRLGLGLSTEADTVEQAVQHVLASGYRTSDIMEPGCTPVTTTDMGDLVAEAIPSVAERHP